jgi:hypothetical protein
MSTDRRWAGRALVVVGLVSTLFAACARGNDIQTTTTDGSGGVSPATSSDGGSGGGASGTGGSGGGGTGGAGGGGACAPDGQPCQTGADCCTGSCVANVCTLIIN